MRGSNLKGPVFLLAVLIAPTSFASANDEDDKPTPAELVQLAEQLSDSLVVVEYTVQSDKGETPGSDWRGMRFTSNFSFGSGAGNWDQLIKQERPGEFAGYLLPENRVLTTDPMLHLRFIKRIVVRAGEQLIEASIDAYGRDRNALFLRLKEPARTGKPLVFDTSKPGPYRSVTFFNDDGTWKISARAVSDEKPRAILTPGQPPKVTYRGPGLYVDKHGVPVAMVMKSELGLDEDWRQSPDDYPTVSANEMRDLLEQLKQVSSAALLRVNLRFRSPRTPSRSSRFGISITLPGEGESEEMTEWNGTGLLVDERTVLVLANLRPKVTGRLEAVRVFTADGEGVEAEFAGTLVDYGGFLVELEKPLPGATPLETGPIKKYEGELLLKAQIRVLGDSRIAYYGRDRVTSFSVGWRRQIYPDVSATSGDDGAPWEESKTPALNVLYTLDGKLIGVPIPKRQKIVSGDRWRTWDPFTAGSNMLAAKYLADVLAGGRKSIDPENRPLTEEEENRLAWLGVELQAMTPDLARMNDVADQTANGTTGAMVTYVYPDSPATQAGLEVGDILLRLHIEGQPKPMEVKLEDESPFGDMMDQFWMIGDQMPPEFFDQMPKPWGSAENVLTRALTDVGFGKHFTAEIFRNGQIITKDFVISEGPPHYDSAKRFKSKAAGFTVRDPTYEVRRYFQLKPDDPGVIVSKVESGRPAAVAGIKPLELILSVNDELVRGAADLERAIANGGEFRLNVKRMTVSRVVTLKIEAESESE